MDLVHRDSEFSRKDKKKKHQRSRSHQHKKKKDRDHQSREHKKKDKQKKHHKDKDRERERSGSHERSRQKKERQISRSPEGKKLEYHENDRYQRRDKDRDRQRDRKHKSRDRRSRSKDKKYDGYNSRKKHDSHRGKSSRKEDTYEKWRKQRDNPRFRFDSPPRSDDSGMQSEDPQKMNRLNKLKAEKELVSSKADRKLYLGNLPPNITSSQLMVMLNTALKKMDINTETQGDSIVSSWVSPDGVGHYAFVEFRTALEATAGLALNGASLYGYQLKLGRPKQYIEYQKQLLSEFGTDGNIDTIIKKVEAMGGYSEPLQIEERLIHPPSRVIVLKHIVTIEQLAIDQQYAEILEDITEMAKRHGDVLKVIIPRPAQIDLEALTKRVKGLGFVFIKYKSVEQARYARKQFIKQMFSERSVACSYFSEERFDVGDLDPIEKVVIDF